MSEEVCKLLDEYVTECLGLRFTAQLPAPESSTSDVLSALLDVRQRLDRVEELLGRAIRVRARVHTISAKDTATVDDLWDQAVTDNRTAAVRTDEYSSAKERHAEANLAVLDHRRTARASADLARHADSVHDLLRLTHQGLNGLRNDLLAMVRAAQLESNLER